MKKLSIILYIITAVIFLTGCSSKQDSAISEEDNTRSGNVAETSLEEEALAAYSVLLSGDRTLIDEEQKETWWIPDFQDETMQYEYAYLDLDNDGIAELVIQMKDDPCGYNGVFHYEDGALYCWQSDGMEGNCRDYPLNDGTMVRQYDYAGSSSYTIFRYRADGKTENISNLFVREELLYETDDVSIPCPYYEIDGNEAGQEEFQKQLAERITDRMLDRSDWTAF